MNKETAKTVAEADSRATQGTSIGYAINLVMDYGNGRQVTISGTLPLNASLTDFNRELDKLRKATNRQQAFVIMRDCEAKGRAERKMVTALEHMLSTYEAGVEAEIKRLREDPESQHGSVAGKIRSQVNAQIENTRTQAVNYKLQKQQEIDQHRANAEIHEVTMTSLQKEIEDTEKDEG